MSATSAPWQCRISIRWEYTTKGERLREVRETPFGQVLTRTGDIELALRQATAAVLNPHIDPGMFSTYDKAALKAKGEKQLHFSRNTIVVDISGPGLTDLSFVDLPGT
jgi:hypothetical protein